MAKKVSTTISVDLSILGDVNKVADAREMSMNRFTEAAWEALIFRLDTGEWPPDVEELLKR